MFNKLNSLELQEKQEFWREKFAYPLDRMFNEKEIRFTTNIFDQDRILEEHAEKVNQLVGEFSMRQRITEFVSKEAADLYYEMTKTSFPLY